MIYVTGDTHSHFDRFMSFNFPQQENMTRDDYVIICGDFGGVWSDSPAQEMNLDWLGFLPFTLLFVTGNHENYDLLEKYEVSEWHGGKVQFIRPNVIHLMRGQVYEIDGKTIFTMGGAACHDLRNGVLDPEDPDYFEKAYKLKRKNEFFRVKGKSWWPQELPSAEEYEEARKNLEAHDNKVDYIITHCAPSTLQGFYCMVSGNDSYPVNELTDFLQDLYWSVSFKRWYLGHYHINTDLGACRILYDSIEPIDQSWSN